MLQTSGICPRGRGHIQDGTTKKLSQGLSVSEEFDGGLKEVCRDGFEFQLSLEEFEGGGGADAAARVPIFLGGLCISWFELFGICSSLR